jgi:hypothetical protein
VFAPTLMSSQYYQHNGEATNETTVPAERPRIGVFIAGILRKLFR